MVNDKPTCPLCLLATQSIIDKLKDNKTEVRGGLITLVGTEIAAAKLNIIVVTECPYSHSFSARFFVTCKQPQISKRYKEGASKHNTLLRCNVSQDRQHVSALHYKAIIRSDK